MLFVVFSVRDEKAQVFSPPVLALNVAMMMRSISDLLMDGKHPYAKHPEDYVLYDLGVFDDNTAAFSFPAAPKSLVVLRDLISREVG